MIESARASTAYRHASDVPELALAPRTVFVSMTGEGAPESHDWYRKQQVVTDIARRLATRSLAPAGTPVLQVSYRYAYDLAQLDIADFYSVHPLAELHYRILGEVDRAATWADVAEARRAAARVSEEGDDLEIFTIPEQLVLQMMHTGPFADRSVALAQLGDAARARGVHRVGPHQEIHLDPLTPETAQNTLRTILREPVEPIDRSVRP